VKTANRRRISAFLLGLQFDHALLSGISDTLPVVLTVIQLDGEQRLLVSARWQREAFIFSGLKGEKGHRRPNFRGMSNFDSHWPGG